MDKKKKLYAVTCECEEANYICVIAYNSKDAINYGRDGLRNEGCYCEFIDFRCKWKKDFNTSLIKDLPLGSVGAREGLKIGAYGFVYNIECDVCGDDNSNCYLVDEKIMCSGCEEKHDANMGENDGK